MATTQQESFMHQLEVTVLAGYTSFVNGWQAASSMLQEPSCTCARACENQQLVMPSVVAEDEVMYPYLTTQSPNAASPFSPRKGDPAYMGSALYSSPPPQAAEAQRDDVNISHGSASSLDNFVAEDHLSADALQQHHEYLDTMPSLDHSNNFSYYADLPVVLRPPTSIANTNVNVAVRAAPWEKFTKPGKPQGAPDAGSSLISKGSAGTSQVASALQSLQPLPEASPLTQEAAKAGQHWQAQRVPEAVSLSGVPAQPATTAFSMPPSSAGLPLSSVVAAAPSTSQAVTGPLPTQGLVKDTHEEPKVAKPKPRVETKSVLSQSAGLKSSAAMALAGLSAADMKSCLSAAAPTASSANTALGGLSAKPTRADAPSPTGGLSAKPARVDATPSDRKSALSVSGPMTSSAGMALAGLSKASAKRRSGSTESVIGGAPPPMSTAPAAIKSDAAPKPAKSSTRPSGSRSQGQTKSVISNMNSSSSASALLAPMLQGQTRKKRPEGADVASVLG